MTGEQRGVLVTLVAVAFCYGAFLVATFRYVAARTPAGIVRQLARTGRPVTVNVNLVNSSAWDPSRPLGHGGFYGPGRVTYTLDDPSTVRARFQPNSARAVERSAPIPAALLPDTPGTHRRRVIARMVIALYLLMGATTFVVTAVLVDGRPSLRLRVAAISALGAIAIAWLITHVVLTRPRRRRRRRPPTNDHRGPHLAAVPRHLPAWMVGYLVVVATLGIAWHLGNLDQPHPMSWASSFLSAGIFVLVSGAALSASLHHHSYLHHSSGSDHEENRRR